MSKSGEEIVVSTLVGHGSMSYSLTCLESLVRQCKGINLLRVHDDGTLTDEDREVLSGHLSHVEFISRREADDLVQQRLKSFPNCLAYRNSFIFGLKLFDVPLFSSQKLCYCDSDIYFVRPFTGLFPLDESCTASIAFITDLFHSYAVRPWNVFPFSKLRVMGRVNAGIISARNAEYDLDYLEWVLGRLRGLTTWHNRSSWIEQTCWAAYGARYGGGLVSEEQIYFAVGEGLVVSDRALGIHFATSTRHRLDSIVQSSRVSDDIMVSRICIEPAVIAGPFALLQSDRSRSYDYQYRRPKSRRF